MALRPFCLRQKRLQCLPHGRVLPRPEPLGFCGVKYTLNSASRLASRAVDPHPDRRQDGQHIIRVDVGKLHSADRLAVHLQISRPVDESVLTFEARFDRCQKGVREFSERSARYHLGTSLCGRVPTFSQRLARVRGLEAGISERQAVLALPLGRAKANLSALACAAHTIHEDPLTPPVRSCLDREVKSPTITVASGLCDCLRFSSGELMQLSFGHVRPTIRPTIDRGLRRTPANFRGLLRNMIREL